MIVAVSLSFLSGVVIGLVGGYLTLCYYFAKDQA